MTRYGMQILREMNSVLACCWAIFPVQIIQEFKDLLTQYESDLQSSLTMWKIEGGRVSRYLRALLLTPVLNT